MEGKCIFITKQTQDATLLWYQLYTKGSKTKWSKARCNNRIGTCNCDIITK